MLFEHRGETMRLREGDILEAESKDELNELHTSFEEVGTETKTPDDQHRERKEKRYRTKLNQKSQQELKDIARDNGLMDHNQKSKGELIDYLIEELL